MVGGGKKSVGGGGGGWSLLPLFLSCLGSLLAPNLCRLLATEAEILARGGGGGRAVCPKLCACLKESRVGAKGRGCRILHGLLAWPPSNMPKARGLAIF